MSIRQNAISVSLISTLLVLGYYLVNIFLIHRQGGLNQEDVFRLWIIIIIASIVLNIAGNIITSIVLSIVHAIRTNSDKEVRFLEDERDQLIELKGTKVAYITSSIGVLIAMLTFMLGHPALVMFSLIIFFWLLAEIIGDLSQFYFYWRGS